VVIDTRRGWCGEGREEAEDMRKDPQAIADQFNAECPVGTPVRYWPMTRRDEPKEGRICHPATVLGGHSAVAWIDTSRGCVALTHVEKA